MAGVAAHPQRRLPVDLHAYILATENYRVRRGKNAGIYLSVCCNQGILLIHADIGSKSLTGPFGCFDGHLDLRARKPDYRIEVLFHGRKEYIVSCLWTDMNLHSFCYPSPRSSICYLLGAQFRILWKRP